jgi:hypothetical protein
MGECAGSLAGALIYAYFGVGQFVNAQQNREVMYPDALLEARDRRNEKAIKDLESVAPYPPFRLNFRKDSIINQWAGELLGPV